MVVAYGGAPIHQQVLCLFFKKEYVLFWCCMLIYHDPVCKAVVMIVCGAFCFDCKLVYKVVT